MSGFLPDLASWALRGGAGNNGTGGNNEQEVNNASSSPRPTLTEDEIRARRLARMTALEEQAERMQTDDNDDKMEVDNSADDMQVDAPVTEESPKKEPSKKEPVTSSPKKAEQGKKKRAKESVPADASRKLQRKKEALLKKVLGISLQKGDSSCECVVTDSDEITTQSIAEIIAMRLAMSPSEIKSVSPQKKELVPYLALSHKKAAEELKALKQKQSKANTQELEELLGEILKQVVSYAASSLIEPDLFEMGKDGTTQLAKCLIGGTTDVSSSITFGVTGTASSFYHCLCEELVLQDMDAFSRVIGETMSYFTKLLSNCDTVLDGGSEGGLAIVSALSALCGHKKAGAAVTQAPNFLLPPADSPQAQERITPPPPTLPPGATAQQERFFRLMQAMNRGGGSYLKRSGPALDKETVLGLVLRLGCPRDNPSVTAPFGNILMQSMDSIEKTIHSQQRQLRIYQDACNQLIRCLITAGAEPRNKVCY